VQYIFCYLVGVLSSSKSMRVENFLNPHNINLTSYEYLRRKNANLIAHFTKEAVYYLERSMFKRLHQ